MSESQSQSTLVVRQPINVNYLATRIPQELLVKIYNEYFRPIKYAELYHSLTIDTLYRNDLFILNSNAFRQHLSIFMYHHIQPYLLRTDSVLHNVITRAVNRQYTSVFTNIPNLKDSLFLEILMNKYH